MKFNKWTVGLAAAGIVTLPSLVQADMPTFLKTAGSDTTISGYVDVSMQWNLGSGNENNPGHAFNGPSKADGFNLNVVDIAIEKPLDESPWAAGYKAELWFGPDANSLGTVSTSVNSGYSGYDYTFNRSDFAIRQAYVTLRTPVGNGIDWKLGVFDTVIGYESTSSPNNPHYTHSWGYSMEPTTHEGILASYRFCDEVSVSVGVANTFGPQIGSRSRAVYGSGDVIESKKTFMGSVSLTAPADWGWLAGSSMTAGFVTGFNGGSTGLADDSNTGLGANQTSFYIGATISTPVTGLKAGVALDYSSIHNNGAVGTFGGGDNWAVALYASYQATEKLSLHARGEYADLDSSLLVDPLHTGLFEVNRIWSLTLTAQYDLWKNVISRAEFRWDHAEHNQPFSNVDRAHAFMFAANVIYKF
jgi:hypothetical protein